MMQELKNKFAESLKEVANTSLLEQLRVEFLGKKGLLTTEMAKLATLTPEQKKAFGREVNELRAYIVTMLEQKAAELQKHEMELRLKAEKIDITLPARQFVFGKLHPITAAINDLQKIFARLGFAAISDREIEDEWHNFTALNMPEHHPARQMHDTFYLQQEGMLLRTHTSSVQIRHMQNSKPPYRMISFGRVYRSDYDATHTPMFHQIEGLYIDKEVNLGHMRYCLEFFLREFFMVKAAPIRLRPSYFPFTEPSFEVDVLCDRSNKEEIRIGVGNDWLEILGCGMVNPQVLHNVGVDPCQYQGFAFGVGIERLAMLRYNIPDLRSLFEGDKRWVDHYGVNG
jgi:phenylalanyl-tRNA synthetase alpha chain